jgi:hypothetical protein
VYSFDREAEVITPFVREGLERGEKAYHIVDPSLRASYTARLGQEGIEVESLQETGQFELRNWGEAYLREGHFDQDAMLELIEQVLIDGREQGSPSLDSSRAWSVLSTSSSSVPCSSPESLANMAVSSGKSGDDVAFGADTGPV